LLPVASLLPVVVEAGAALAHRFAVQLDLVGIVHQAVEDRIRQGGVAEARGPAGHGQLAGDQRRAASVTVLEDLQKVAAFGVGERLQAEVVEDEQVGPAGLPEMRGTRSPEKVVASRGKGRLSREESCYYSELEGAGVLRGHRRYLEVAEGRRLGELQGGEDLALAGRGQ